MWLGSELSFYTGISSGLSRVTEIAVWLLFGRRLKPDSTAQFGRLPYVSVLGRIFGLKTEDVTGVCKKCIIRGVILGMFRRIHLLWASPSFFAQWGECFMSSYMSNNLRCVVAFISTACRLILFVLLGDELKWLWPETRTCVPWCPMPFRQRSFAVVSLHHFSTSRSALPSAVECMYVGTFDKQQCLILFTVQKTDTFLASFVIILYDCCSPN
jgi:hypothetical protein